MWSPLWNYSIKCTPTQVLLLLTSLLMTTAIIAQRQQHHDNSCQKIPIENTNDNSLRCTLRTLNNDLKLNTSLLQAAESESDSIISVALICSDVLFYQSSLGRLPFGPRLGSLSIEHCKLSRLESGVFSGLGLKNLTIQTHNTAWPALSLDLSPGLFNNNAMSMVERIDFSQNNIWTFPTQIFCPTESLYYLNVSMNRLQDIHDLGFGFNSNNKQTQATNTNNRSPSSSVTVCVKNSIQILDISYNRLILLPPNGLSKLNQLKELYLQGNEISVVTSRAFANLKRLRILNLADNRVTSLPGKLFHDSSELTEIYLQNNSLVYFQPRLLQKLEQLLVLDLSHNSLTSDLLNGDLSATEYAEEAEEEEEMEAQFDKLTFTSPLFLNKTDEQIFSKLIRLVLLNLGYNQLSKLGPKPFQDLYSLQILNLEHNQIALIEPNTFSAMNNLHTLILSHNQLSVIDGQSLNGLFILSQLSLDNNNISAVQEGAFKNCSSITDLNVNGNKLTSVGNVFHNLTQLKTLDLGENQLVETPLLVGLPALYGVRLTGNRIVSVNVSAFRELSSLKILNLARNSLRFVSPGSFDLNVNLQAVRLDGNYLDSIQGLFVSCVSLIWLNVSDNSLSYFDYAMIPGQLQWIDLHKNLLGELGNAEKRTDVRLQTLDASFNRISSVGSVNLPDSLEMIFLNDNLISSIEPHTFYKKSNLSRVDIFANQIETLELSSLRLAPISIDKPIPEMYLGGNPIICDCNSEWLQRINGLDHLRQHFKIMDLESIYCRIFDQMSGPQSIDAGPYEQQQYNDNDQLKSNLQQNESQLSSPSKYSVVPLMTVTKTQFLCPYTNHCFNLCQCCEYNACDCQQQCPSQCNCFNDDVWATNIVDCANNNLHKIPHIPMDASHLYLDGNQIQKLTSHVLIARKNLIILHLNNSQIQSIANNSLNGLKRLEILRLQDNQLTQLIGNEFQDLTQLKELYLHNNQLFQINNHTFSSNLQLEILTLNNNRLKYFTFNILTHNSYLIDINLGHNPWTCQCQFLANVLPWLQSNIHKISDVGEIQCRTTHVENKYFFLTKLNSTTRCSELSSFPIEAGFSPEEPSLNNYWPVLCVVMFSCLIFGGAMVFLCRKRKVLGNWVATSKCCRSSSSALDEEDSINGEKLFDAYVAYSLKDETWVQQILATELESTTATATAAVPYRICLHYKFPLSAYIVSDTIVQAVESSKRTIIVISKNFLQNEWCRFEFKSALCSVVNSGKKVIAITLGDIPITTMIELDTDLRNMLRSALLLNSNDKLFLSKLKDALPEPRRKKDCKNSNRRIKLSHSNGNGTDNNTSRIYHKECSNANANYSTLNLAYGGSGLSNSNSNYPLLNGSLLYDQYQRRSSNCATILMKNNNPTNIHNNLLNASSTQAPPNSGIPMFVPPFPPPNRPPPPFPPPEIRVNSRPPSSASNPTISTTAAGSSDYWS